jgi:hypothetical protein
VGSGGIIPPHPLHQSTEVESFWERITKSSGDGLSFELATEDSARNLTFGLACKNILTEILPRWVNGDRL